MGIKRKTIELFIQNNTPGIVPLSLLNQLNDLDNSNALTEYRWDISAETFVSKDFISILWKATGQAAFQTKVLPLRSATVAGVVAALNTFGISTFFNYTSGGTFISTYSDNYVFGNMDIYGSAGSTLNVSSQLGDLGIGYALSGYNFQGSKNAVNRFTRDTQPGSALFNDTGGVGDVFQWTANNPGTNPAPIHFYIFSNAGYGFYLGPITIPVGGTLNQGFVITQQILNQEGNGGLIQAFITN